MGLMVVCSRKPSCKRRDEKSGLDDYLAAEEPAKRSGQEDHAQRRGRPARAVRQQPASRSPYVVAHLAAVSDESPGAAKLMMTMLTGKSRTSWASSTPAQARTTLEQARREEEDRSRTSLRQPVRHAAAEAAWCFSFLVEQSAVARADHHTVRCPRLDDNPHPDDGGARRRTPAG